MTFRHLIGIIATTLVVALTLILCRNPDTFPHEPGNGGGRQAPTARFYPGSEDLPGAPTQVRLQDGAEPTGPAIIPAVQRTRESHQPIEPQPEPWA